jgi:hypothetical protein
MRLLCGWTSRLLTVAVLLAAAGCGQRLHRVQGKVTYSDGTPVTEGLVVFESIQEPIRTARGDIRPDGSYELSTHKPGDGVAAGKYRVLVAPRTDPNAIDKPKPPPFDRRYSEFATSGLELEVKPGTNEFPIQVTRGRP